MATKFKAVLSTTVLPVDGNYTITTIETSVAKQMLKDVPHFVGHPATKEIIESLGSVQAPSKLFLGLQPGESAICCSIKQGQSNRGTDGFSAPHQEVEIDNLVFRSITRAEICSFCGEEARLHWGAYCSNCGAT